MAFSRNSMAAAIAGSLSLAVLTGCNPPAAVVAPSAAPSAAASAAASAAPSAAPSAAASTAASAAPATPAPVVSAPAASGKTVTVSGKVYDDKGALVDGATITVKSLNDANAYSATAKTVNGNYVFNSIPEGVQVAITATKDKWTARTRTEAFQASATIKNEVNFGGATSGGTDPYFISKYAEIVSTTPAEEATGVDSSKVSYKLILSEALDETNRRRFESKIQLAAGGARPIQKGTTFLGDADTKATVTWNAAGTEATLTFNAPLLADSSSELEYEVTLVGNNDIEDTDGNEFAGDSSQFLFAFKRTDLPLISTANGALTAWEQTHEGSSTFKVAEDDTDPKLTGVAFSKLDSSSRLELTFSEPMQAFGATLDSTVTDLLNYSFIVGKKAGDLKSSDLDGDIDPNFTFDGSNGATKVGDAANEVKTEFKISNSVVEVDSKDAKRIFINLANKDFFDPLLAEIKARVSGVEDPAGNAIGGTDADNNPATGLL